MYLLVLYSIILVKFDYVAVIVVFFTQILVNFVITIRELCLIINILTFL